MGAFQWIAERWFEFVQTGGIIAGLLFSAFTAWKDERARKISNLIELKKEHREIWREVYDRPELNRILKREVDLGVHPISGEEAVFVKSLILHLDTVHRAIKAGMFVKLEGLETDVRDFFSSPIPRAIWEKLKPLQDKDFVNFVEASLP